MGKAGLCRGDKDIIQSVNRYFVRQFIPPIFTDVARWIKNKVTFTPFYGVSGNFPSWQEALTYCAKYKHGDGYKAANIIDKVANAIQIVRKGDAEFERDSVLFYEKDYNYQLLTALFLSFSGFDDSRPISVVDFGGSLGSTFFQNRSLFASMKQAIVWNVVEQKHFVDCGRQEVPEVNFYYSMEEFHHNGGKCDVLLCSAVLDYLPTPDDFLESVLKYSWKYILIDRSLFHPEDIETIGVQTVPSSIYDGRYPLWLRSASKQDKIMNQYGFKQILKWESSFSMPYLQGIKGKMIPLQGFLYKKIESE